MIKKILISAYVFLVSFGLVFAQLGGETGDDLDTSLPNPLQVGDITELLNRISYYLVVLVGPPIVTVMILYGAFQILTAAGDPEKFKNGRKTILFAAIGYGVLLIAHGITFIIKEILGFQG